MFVRLLQTVIEHDRHGNPVGVKTVIRKPRATFRHYTSGPKVELVKREPVVFVKGAVVDMSEASAAKYIEAGLAEKVEGTGDERQEDN